MNKKPRRALFFQMFCLALVFRNLKRVTKIKNDFCDKK